VTDPNLTPVAEAVATMNPAEVMREQADRYGVSVEALQGRGRTRWISTARAAVASSLRDLGLSTGDIGRMLGGRHHTTIMYLLEHQR
jgi:chromosomal replication initiation ATPase DnaA